MGFKFAPLHLALVILAVISIIANPVTAYGDTDEPPILPGYTRFPNLNVDYKVHNEIKTWSEARQICIDEGSRLAIIDTMEKVNAVAGLKGFNVYVWVGIWRTGWTQPWMSAGNNMHMSNLPWAPGKPWGWHNCLGVRGCNRGLTNESCNSRLGFVCERRIRSNSDQELIAS